MQQISTNYIERLKQTLAVKSSPQVNDAQTNSQIDTLSNVTPDFNVNVPISYQKVKDINLPYDLNASCYKLANGQNVIIIPKDGTTVVKTYVKTGSMNEPDHLRGISHYIEHNLFNGSDGLDDGEFFRRVNDIGANTNASTGFAETNYFISSNLLNENDLEEKIKLQASMLQSPHFALDKLEKEKGIVNSEINMILSNPDNLGYNRVIKNLYNINSTSTDLIGGTTQNITNLTREDVVNYYNQNYYPANMTTVITGDVDADETIKLVAKYFNSQKLPPQSRNFEEMKPLQTPKREDIISDKAYATSIFVGFNGPKNCEPEEHVLMQAVSRILTGSKNSRISKELKQYSTDVFMGMETVSTKPSDGIALVFSAESTEENSAQILKIIIDKIDELKYKLPTEEEMNRIKKSMKKEFAYIFELSDSINATIGECVLDGSLYSLNDYENMVDSLTPQDISNAAKKYLDTNKASIIMMHPENVDESEINKNYVNANITFTGASETKAKNTSKKPLNMDKVQSYKLSNNLRILTNNTQTNNCEFAFSLGSDLPANVNPATPILLNKILNAGSEFRNENEFLKDLEKDAISMGFSCGEKTLNVSGSFSSEDIDKALKAMKEVLFNPRFTEENFNIAKNNIEKNLKTSDKSPLDKLNKELFPNDNYGATKEEILDGLNTVTLTDVRGLYEYLMQNPNASIVVSAPFPKRHELKNILFNELGTVKPLKEFTPLILNNYKSIEKTKVLTDTHYDYQADIIEAFKFKNNGNLKDDVTIMLLNIILGGTASSRLFNDLREEQKLAYSVKSSIKYNENSGIMMLRIGTTTDNNDNGEVNYDNVQKSIDGFNKHIQKISNEKVTDKELENAKLYLKNSLLSDNEDIFGQTTALDSGYKDYYGVNKQNLTYEMIDKITPDDILLAAKYIFSTKPVYSINATQNTLDANKEYFKKLETA